VPGGTVKPLNDSQSGFAFGQKPSQRKTSGRSKREPLRTKPWMVGKQIAIDYGWYCYKTRQSYTLFVWLISHQPTVLFSQNKPATSNQSAVLFSQNKSAPTICHQPNEHAASLTSLF
jgi:hypothetical protein